ncbi:hypothetical protein BRPE64_ACDS27850 [Caballeronia insecticola]|uniref:Uncharacterized protein n=1 Tax=Caballeronia insecticola TaxID=758793 RepID=R4WJH1_9BURK|nr:hypothetical protein BRPE64_ACDS27850 [Caballeronia insecticola]
MRSEALDEWVRLRFIFVSAHPNVSIPAFVLHAPHRFWR